MDVTSLTLLVQIIDSGNLSKAARQLNMSRANVSYHLNQLERAVGQQLLRRTTRRIEPTEIGLKLYEHGVAIRNELLAARESVAALGQELQGRVRLSVPSGYGQVVMTPWLLEFKRRHPGIVLEVVFENFVSDLLRDGIDIAVRVLSQPPQSLVSRLLGRITFIACVSREFAQARGIPRHLDDLLDLPLVTTVVVGRKLRLVGSRRNDRHEVLIEPTLISENFIFLQAALLEGLGVALVPDYLVAEELASGAVVRVLADWRLSTFGTGLHLLYMPNRHHTRAMSTFIDFLLERARASSATGGPRNEPGAGDGSASEGRVDRGGNGVGVGVGVGGGVSGGGGGGGGGGLSKGDGSREGEGSAMIDPADAKVPTDEPGFDDADAAGYLDLPYPAIDDGFTDGG